MSPFSLLAQYDIVGMPEIFLWPGVFTLVGLAIWGVAWKLEKGGGNAMFKWVAMVPLAVAAFLAWKYFSLAIDGGIDGTMFRDSIGNSKRLVYGAYFAFLFPVASILGLIGWFFIDKKLSRYR